MTTVSGDIRLVSDAAAPVSQVWVRAPKLRASDGAVVPPFNDHFPVRKGRVSFNCRPGPARVTLIVAGVPSESFDILVAGESLDLAQAAADFLLAEGQSEQTLAGYLQAMREVESAVRGFEGVASQAADRAGVARDDAESFASAANDSSDAARGHKDAAQSQASAAEVSAKRAEGAREEARRSWDGAQASASQAAGSRDEARDARDKAREHSQEAERQAGRSENAANRLWDSVAWNGDRLTVADRQSEPLTGPQGPPGPAGSLDGLEPETIVRTGAQDTRLGKYLTVDATDQGNASASLFLKKNDHQYEFFTNAAGKFGAWDKRHSRGLFQADRNTFDHQTAVSMGNNQLRGLPRPTGNDHAATKEYVDGAVSNVSVDTSGLLSSSDVGSGESTEGNKLVRRKGDGAIVVPTTGTERRVAVSRGEVDDKLAGKAASEHTHTMAQISDLRPDTLIRSGSEPELGRTATITASGGTYYAILKQVNGSHTLEQYWTPSGDYGIYSGGENRIVAKANVFEHHTATDMRGNELRGLRAPTADNHAATKAYVDATVSGVRDSVGELQSRIQLVDSLPRNPDSSTLYLIAE
ncbi:hypothetical protein [Corynebacterium propinquum]|uniref:hypothetical protein n=1 Tax=Corynebacterium propinquum TaxID=43769 RepID=UPI0025423493|nr:hypothetical protein [Corynebacterium propinquum]